MTSRACGYCSAMTTGTPGLRIPAFSPAISFSEWPRKFSWSKSMRVIIMTAGERMFVASRRPPRPTSKTPNSTRSCAKHSNVTAMAFECFAHERVEFGVFEVGLGGRLDATNILSPAVMMITRIDFDHENFLGHSLKEIAGEKAGILKPGVPVVMAEQYPQAREVILARANEVGCQVVETASAYQIAEESSQNGFF